MSTVGCSSSQMANPDQTGSDQTPKTMPAVPNPNLPPGYEAPKWNGTEPTTPIANPQPLRCVPPPVPESAASSASASASAGDPEQKRRRQLPPGETPNWLPAGWIVETRVRASGNSAGTTDKYYKDPVSGRTFRSKKDVEYFLQHGSLPKRGKAVAKETPEVKTNADGSKVDDETVPQNCDSDRMPFAVTWVLDHPDTDTWIPYVDGQRVPEERSKQWTSVFKTPSRLKN